MLFGKFSFLTIFGWWLFVILCFISHSITSDSVTSTLSDGLISYTVSSQSDTRTWVITPAISSTTMSITFEALNINQAELRIFETYLVSQGISIWSCASCGALLPPPFTSTTGSITITIRGVTGASFTSSNFRLRYLGIPANVINLSRNISRTLNMGYASITPFAVSGKIPVNSTQRWELRPSGTNQITFMLSYFLFSTSCLDTLTIYNGNNTIIFQGCQPSDMINRWFYSTSSKATVIYTTKSTPQSTATTTSSTFKLTYYTDTSVYNCGSFVQPETLNGDSVMFYDGSKSSELMRRGMDCRWRIASNQHNGTINLIFNRVSIKYGGSVVVYDGSSTSNTVLWNGNGATTTVPPIITSSGQTLFIVYISDSTNAVKYYGFLGEYYMNYLQSMGSGRGYTTLAMSSSYEIMPPGNLTMATTSNLTYTWYITPSIMLNTIWISFCTLQFTSNTSQLYLYDGLYDTSSSSSSSGTLLGQFNNTNLPTVWYKTTGTSATLIYVTNNNNIIDNNQESVNNNFFQLAYYADGPNYHCGFIRNPLRLTYISWMITDGSQSVETIYTSQTCTWIIAPQDSIGLYLFFTRFSLWEGTLAIYLGDTITSSQLFTEITDTNAVPSFLYFPNESVVTLQYITASSNVAGYGFFLTYFGIQPNKTTSFPGNQLVTLKQSTGYNFMFSIQDNLQLLEAKTNLTYQILPLSATGRLYFALSQLLISNCDLHIFIYDASTIPTDISDPFTATSSSILTHLTCNSTFPVPYKWYMTTSTSAIVQFYSNNTQPTVFSNDSSEVFSYEMSYYSDGNNYHCGFFNNPMIVTAPSMIITDGSSSTEIMGSDQSCTWIIAPSLPNQPVNSSSDYLIIWEFISVDLVGGKLSIYAIEDFDISSDSTKELLYECIECSYIPQPIIIQGTKKQLYIEFTSYSSSYLGAGFSAVYWTTNATNWYSTESTETTETTSTSTNSFITLLEVPNTIEMTNDISNNSMKYAIDVHPSFVNQLTYIPKYLETTTIIDETDNNYFTNQNVYDGRPNEVFASQQSAVSLCGQVLHTPRPSTSSLPTSPYELNITLHQAYIMTYKMTQQQNKYLYSRVSNKRIIDIESSTSSTSSTTTNTTSSIFSAKQTCQYSLFQYGNTNNQAILVTINALNIEETKGRVRVYGGYTGNDDLLFDTQTDYPVQTSSTGEETLITFPYNLTLPCGRGLILVEYINNTNTSSFSESYSMDVSYQVLLSDEGALCDAYLLSLYPPPKKKNPYLPYIYAGIGVAGIAFLCILTIQLLKLKHKRGYIFYPEPELLFGGGNNGLTYSIARKPTSPWRSTSSWYNYLTSTHTATGLFHPVYSPHYDKIKNYFLPKDKCCICQSEDHQVFMLKCHHNICLECTHSYLLTALGDISMFPVKCPMHYEGCTSSIDASIAKRIFTYDQYIKYLEFLDRAIFGDGMRCIFCQHFVNFPEDSSRYTRVECPYCTQKFCLRCKKPWHTQGKCPLDMVDESLEEWKVQSGAQKCPCCRKIIEKDDPDTCNHMVHRITDAIPCVRERTDFCYLCGEEVEADYPHDEVKRPGINHFPEGVFQKCRKIILKEREEEREKMRRQKRRKNNFNSNNNNPSDSSSNSTMSNRRTNHVVPYQQHDWEELSSIEEPPSLLFPTPQTSPTRPMPYNPFFIPEEEQQQSTPTTTTPATPSQIILNNFIGDEATNNNTNNRNRYDQITDHFDTQWGIVMNQNRTLRPIGTPPNTTTSNNINNNINFPLSLTPIGSPTRQRPPIPNNTTNTPNSPLQTRSIPRNTTNTTNSSPTRLRPANSSAPVTPQGSGRYTQQQPSSQTITSMTTNTTPNTSGQNSPSRTRPQRQFSRHPSTNINAIYPIS